MRSPGPVRQTQRTGGTPGLAREITPALLLLLFIVGDILGGGIYALVGEVGERTGGGIWAAVLLALVMAAFTAGFLVAFAVMASGVTSASALARGFGVTT
jgi:basic amino acid/polyamine antiporter, APA family